MTELAKNGKDGSARVGSGLRTLERGLAVLELLGTADGGYPVSEVAQRLRLPMGTTHRLLQTLLQVGYVEQDPRTRRYQLGLKILELRGATVGAMRMAAEARPLLRDLMQRTCLRAHLAVYRGGSVVYVDRVDNPTSLTQYVPLGKRAAAHATGLGKAILAHSAEEEVAALLARQALTGFTSTTITDGGALRRGLVERRVQAPPRDDRHRAREGTAARRERQGGVAAVGDRDEGAVGPPAPERQRQLARPIGQRLVPPAALPVVPLGVREGRQDRQRPDPARPRDRHQQQQAGPARRAGLDDVAAAGAHRIAIDPLRHDPGAAAALPRLVDAKDERAVEGEDGDEQAQPHPTDGQAGPPQRVTLVARLSARWSRANRPPCSSPTARSAAATVRRPGARIVPTTRTGACRHTGRENRGANGAIGASRAGGKAGLAIPPPEH